MSIVEQIQRIDNNIKASYTALADKGATLPAKQNSNNLANTIANLEVGGGSGGSDELLKAIVEGTAKDIVLPDNIEIISTSFFRGTANYAFANSGLKSIKANGVTELKDYAIYSHYKTLETIELPNLKIIGNYGLANSGGSDSLKGTVKKLKLGALEKIGNYGLEGIFNPDTSISQEIEMSFNNCEIGNYAFKYYNYASFDGTGVKSLGQEVFSYASTKFKKVWFPSTIESMYSGSTMFRASGSITIYTDVTEDNVPSGWGTNWNKNRSGYSATITTVYGATYADFLNA